MDQITKDIAAHAQHCMISAFHDALGLCETDDAKLALSVHCVMHVAGAAAGVLMAVKSLPEDTDPMALIEGVISLIREAKGGA